MYDAIVIGGGHNGLTCAAYLAREGKRVVVLEAATIVGGFATTEARIPEAPGFLTTPCAIDLLLTNIPRSIIDELDLPRYGLRWVPADPYCSYIGPDGISIAQWRDLDRTVAEIARLSPRDAARYERFAKVLGDLWYAITPYMQGHPTKVKPKTLAELVWRLGKTRKSLGVAARIMLQSPISVLEEWFQRDELKAMLGSWSVAGMAPLEQPGYAALMSMVVMPHRWGCRRAIGGMGAFTQAIADCVKDHGGEVRTLAPVREVITENDRAVGVVLDNGEALRASHVIATVDPTTLLTKLVDPSLVPEQVRDEMRGMTVLGNNMSYFTGHAALNGRPTLPSHGREDELLRAGYIITIPDYAYLRRSVDATKRGELSDEIPMWLSFPSVSDRTLVPPGSDGDCLYIMVPAAPYELAGGADWATEKEKYLDRCLDIVDGYSPGIKESVIGTYAKSPKDMSPWIHKGNSAHVDMSLSQLGPWRPTPSLAGFKTPVDRLWHAGAGAHPIPAVNGWSGRTAARTVLQAMRKSKEGFRSSGSR